MSFSSKSSKGNHYREGNQGSSHYQKNGFLGNLLKFIGSKSGSDGSYRNQYQNSPINNQIIGNQKSMSCSKCSSQIPAGSKFCLQCGEKVNDVVHCMNCGEKMPSNAKFCLKCGKKISE